MELSHYESLLAAIETLSKKIESSKKVSAPSRSAEIKDLCAALSKAQGEIEIAGLNKENPYFKSRYADMAEIVRVSRPALSKNGLSVMQQILTNEDGQSILHTLLCHSTGQWMESQMRIIPPKNDIQSLSSYVTYLKRISYAALIGVVVGNEDDDGEVAMISARQVLAKGPAINAYDPKKESHDTITKEQLQEMEYELAEYPDLAEEIMEKMQIQSLADLPKTKYHVSMTRIRQIKGLRNGTIKQ